MDESRLNIYPALKYCRALGERINSEDIRLEIGNEIQKNNAYYDILKNFYVGENYKFSYKLILRELSDYKIEQAVIPDMVSQDEVYAITVCGETVCIFGDSDKAFFYGALTLRKLLESNSIYEEINILDYPHMKIRGIIEGFYGKPWSMKDRIDGITTISSNKMNTYIYAPKDDPYHRDKWFEAYPEGELARIKELYDHCRYNFVDFYYTIGPGLSMKYSSEENFEVLYKKYVQLFNIGVRHFGILFDDIPSRLMHYEDKEHFGELAAAHGFVVKKLYEKLKGLDQNIQLILCGTLYYGRGDEAYAVKLGNLIPEEIRMFWTGRSVCSQELDTRDAVYFKENTGHMPLYWDNYPVNDANMQYELHLGPVIGRDKDLYKFSEGIVSNVMECKEASMIPVITVCHYLWDSEKYNSEQSLRHAVMEIAGIKDYEKFIRFNNYCMKSCLTQTGSDDFIERVVEFKCAANKDKDEFLKTLAELKVYFKENAETAAYLLMNMENRKLLKEVEPWLKKYKDFNRFCRDMIEYIIFTLKNNKLKALLIGMKALFLFKRLDKNPIQMMNFEAQVLIQSGKA